jgi:hypothetical protein
MSNVLPRAWPGSPAPFYVGFLDRKDLAFSMKPGAFVINMAPWLLSESSGTTAWTVTYLPTSDFEASAKSSWGIWGTVTSLPGTSGESRDQRSARQ